MSSKECGIHSYININEMHINCHTCWHDSVLDTFECTLHIYWRKKESFHRNVVSVQNCNSLEFVKRLDKSIQHFR